MTMKDNYAYLEQKVLHLENEARKRHTMETKLIEYALDNTKFLKVLQDYEKRAEFLSNRLQAHINRECVLTEVSQYARRLGSIDIIANFHIQIMKAYNLGDEFWEQRNSAKYSIAEWFDLIMAIEVNNTADAIQSSLYDLV